MILLLLRYILTDFYLICLFLLLWIFFYQSIVKKIQKLKNVSIRKEIVECPMNQFYRIEEEQISFVTPKEVPEEIRMLVATCKEKHN